MYTTRKIKRDYEQEIVDALTQAGGPRERDALARAVGLSPKDEELAVAMGDAQRDCRVVKTRDGRYALPRQVGMISGRLSRTSRGFGFVGDGAADDVFIPPRAMAGAMGGDIVLADILPLRPGAKGPEGRITKIVRRVRDSVVGRIDMSGRIPRLLPSDPSLCDPVYVDKRFLNGARDGDMVVLEMRTYSDGTMPAYGMVREVLGDPGTPGCDITSIMRAYGLYEEFPEAVQKESDRYRDARVSEAETKSRRDFRDVFTVTVDGADSKDFDDAVGVVRGEGRTIRLFVHIADVSHYVTPGTELDREAFDRGTSAYLPDRVAPMLPLELSNGICSLNEGQDRLCMSAVMDFDENGRLLNSEIMRGVIRVDHRLVYDDVTAYFKGGAQAAPAFDKTLCGNLDVMRELFERLDRVRAERGSIDFDLPETEIVLDARDHAIDIRKKETGPANAMIESFMLAANETVAKYVSALEIPCIYRVHEEPDKEKVKAFGDFIGLFGYKLPKTGNIRPKAFRELLLKIKGSDEEAVISRLMLRSMQKARYAADNLGHYGLALEDYCHFTSPIRRYPDLMVHRVLGLHFDGAIDETVYRTLADEMDGIAEQCSQRERNAMEAERAADDLKKSEYMHDHLGEEFPAVVSGVANYGFYAELDNTVEGLVRITSLHDDEYMIDDMRCQLIGKRTRRTFRIGDRIAVVAAGADPVARTVDFSLHEKA